MYTWRDEKGKIIGLMGVTRDVTKRMRFEHLKEEKFQVQKKLEVLEDLNKRKLYEKESYEEVIWDLIEDTMELSKEAKVMLRKAEEDIKSGRVHSFEKVKRELNL